MAIDKIQPKFINSDAHERLLKNGELKDAVNVTLGESGSGTSGVLKNVKGTIPGRPTTLSDLIPDAFCFVVGEVSDSQRGYIYYFVRCEQDPRNRRNYIFRYDVNTDRYIIALADARLNFRRHIKADVLNGDFQMDGVLQTILYFTDGDNPPRKINIDRAIAGDYNGLSNSRWEFSVNTIKAAPLYPPVVSFENDSSIPHNNFKNKPYQFATQIVYRDGEESALSPYSKLAKPIQLAYYNLDEPGFSVPKNADNVCIINHQIETTLVNLQTEVERIRIYARLGNEGAFNLIDDFNPRDSKSRSVFNNQDVEVYSPSTEDYRFYNDVLGTPIPDALQSKLYDNVPQTAVGQTIAGNRLMYSNYTDGYPNVDVKGELTPIYAPTESEDIITQAFDIGTYTSNNATFPGFNVDFNGILEANGYNAGEPIPAGAELSFRWSIQPNITQFQHQDGEQLFDVILQDQAFALRTFKATGFANELVAQLTPIEEAVILNPDDQPISQVLSLLAGQIEQVETDVTYDVQGDDVLFSDMTTDYFLYEGIFATVSAPNGLTITWKYQAAELNGVLSVTPYIERISFLPSQAPEATHTSDQYSFDIPLLGTQGWEVNYTEGISQNDALLFGSFTNAYSNLDADLILRFFPEGFKSGALHPLGIVYYDRFGRSGYVNDLGVAYAGWYNDHDRIKDGETAPAIGADINSEIINAGPAAIEVKVKSIAPEWAESFQFVYPGNSTADDFIQYTVGTAFPARKGELVTGTTRAIDSESKRLYISLKSLSIYNEEKDSSTLYTYREGDKLRVINFRGPLFDGTLDDNQLGELYPSASDGTVIEFNVVGVETLQQSLDNPIAFSQVVVGGAETNFTSVAEIDDRYTGDFIVVEAPEIAGGLTGLDGAQLKYDGFDWFTVANDYDGVNNYFYPDGTLPTSGNYDGYSEFLNNWQKQCLVEIYNPREEIPFQFYYEVGDAYRIYRGPIDPDSGSEAIGIAQHGIRVVTSGDVHYRFRPCKGPSWVDTDSDGIFAFNWEDPDDWKYKTKLIESFLPSENIYERMWDKGRAHIKYDNAATLNRFNSITYSEPYNEEVDRLVLSSFDANQSNFYSLDSKFGGCHYISSYGTNERLLAIQDNRVSKTGVGTSVIEDASGNQNLALSRKVLSSTTYYTGDYGSSKEDRSAVLIQDQAVFFFDSSRKKSIRISSDRLTPISDQGYASTIELLYDAFNNQEVDNIHKAPKKIISGYDPNDDVYYLTFHIPNDSLSYGSARIPLGTYTLESTIFPGSTVCYQRSGAEGGGRWQSRMSFVPDIYSNQNNTMYSTQFVEYTGGEQDPNLLFHRHGDDAFRTAFYNQGTSDFSFECVSNKAPSSVKVYNSISIEGDLRNVPQLNITAESDLGHTNGINTISVNGEQDIDVNNQPFSIAKRREGSIFFDMPLDVSVANDDANQVYNAEFQVVGVCESFDGNEITFSNSLNGVSILGGATLQYLGDGFTDIGTVANVADGKVFVSNEITEDIVGQDIYMLTNIVNSQVKVNGHKIRGHYVSMHFNMNSSNMIKIYAVNANYALSSLHHDNS